MNKYEILEYVKNEECLSRLNINVVLLDDVTEALKAALGEKCCLVVQKVLVSEQKGQMFVLFNYDFEDGDKK